MTEQPGATADQQQQRGRHEEQDFLVLSQTRHASILSPRRPRRSGRRSQVRATTDTCHTVEPGAFDQELGTRTVLRASETVSRNKRALAWPAMADDGPTGCRQDGQDQCSYAAGDR